MKTARSSIRLRNLRPLAAALLSASVCMAVAANPKVSQFYEDALVRYEKKDYAGAAVQLKNVLRLDAKNLSAQVLMGRALVEPGELNAAEVAFAEALKLGVNRAEVVLPLGQVVVAQGRPAQLLDDERFGTQGLPNDTKAALLMLKAAASSDMGRSKDAMRMLDEARALNPGDVSSWVAEVPIRVRARQFAEARIAADKALSIDAKSSSALYQRATVSHVSGDTKGAIGFYSKAIEVKPGHIDALVARAGLYLDTAQLDAATADITAARKADPKDPRSAYMAAMLAERAGQKTKARDALNEVANLLDPLPLDYIKFRPQILMLGGMSHYALGQFEKAKPYLEATLRQDPSSPVSKMLADIYLRERRIDLNVEMLETYLRTSPNDLQALLQLATSTLSLGRNARAGQIAEAALKLKDDATARAVLGTSLVNSGQVEKGVAELEKALKLDPRQLPAGILLTNLYLASAQSRPAVDSARNLVKHHANNAGAHNLLGLALLGAGEEPQSRAAFEQALAIDAKHVDAQLNLSRLDTNRRDFPAALKHLNAVIGRDDKNLEAILETARHFHVRGQPDEALKWLQRAEDLSGNRLEPGLRMVEFQLERGRADLADQAVSKLRSKAPEALLVLLAQARVQLALGDAQASRSTLARASTLVSFDAAALTQIADLQVRASDVAGAAHSLDKALSSRPGHLRARVMRSNVHLLQGQADKAEQLARDVLKTDPTSGLGDSLLGDVARHRGQMAAAIEAYRKAHERQGTTQSVLALFNAQQATQPAAASSLIERWLKTHPNDTTAWRALGDLRARSGDWAAAKPVYEKLAQLQPRDAEVLNNLANVLVNAKDPRALAVAEQAMALKPGTPHIIGTTGWAAFQAGQQQKALQLLRDARLRDPANASTRYFLAAALAKQGLQGEARQELSAAVQQGGAAFPYASEAAALQRSLN